MNFASQTDPFPYIAGAYIVGASLIFGYAIYLLWNSKKLETLLTVLKEENKDD